mmetsp:Transcript_23076/g.39649  ORF Transcript_23076/g.39649 Transcript_23076/m.39649 type:complete len:564 (-) Transcript_23076:287-1978(-)|eukprot:CAMPEP_0196664562 /NCGR_PEP_ID=MMETSP1086-20130531/57601_1 /TAXON_ID=77921 /ORGANISM="Cyanoptyche  gloeocystis , Strain SAG4.97" /LENGTH=563 /DNA_ID=CAMNT_0042000935 /DNA_START=143 /DNA_END=1834 /DNA_ORIENTATION=+
MLLESFDVRSPFVSHTEEYIFGNFEYETNEISVKGNHANIKPSKKKYTFRTTKQVPKLGVMIVGWAGNNGTTLTAAVMANKNGITWRTKRGEQRPNYYGSLTQASTVRVGIHGSEEVHVPFKSLLPMVDPNNIVFGGWDISGMNLADAMERAQVLDYDLQRQLRPHLAGMKALPSFYHPEFIASNQEDRADNVLHGSLQSKLDQLRQHIRDFKSQNGLAQVIVLWSATTERFCEIIPEIHDTADHLLAAIKKGHAEISPSTLFAVASILEGCPYINGSPQNTFVPGAVELAIRHDVVIAGDDFKTGQTKFKSVLVDFLIQAGIKPMSIVSYNHLGNNDGKNLSAPKQFRSKEVTKSTVVDDMVASAEGVLYSPGEKPDHVVVIKYVPYVGDSKRAMDEYTSEIFMGGQNTIVVHNTCEDSLLAAPVILDLIILAEMFSRISWKKDDSTEFEALHPVLSSLSYLLKAPLVPAGTPVVNSFFRQRACIENILRACAGLPLEHHMLLENKCVDPHQLPRPTAGKLATYANGHGHHANGGLPNGSVNGQMNGHVNSDLPVLVNGHAH